MKAFLFPGQGSQTKGMGESLFDEFPEITHHADDILGYSIKNICMENPGELLNLTRYTQPALFTVNALSYFKKIKSAGKPDFVAGHSLGEYNALLAAEVFDFQTGLQLVKKRSELMSNTMDGAMIAVIGLKKAEIQHLLEKNNLTSISIANHNSYSQSVLSGSQHNIEQIKLILAENANIRMVPLKVSGAFHSQLMLNAENEFSEFLNNFNFATPTLPVISNINAKPYHPQITKHNLAKQITHTVQWVSTIEYLLSHKNLQLEEVGPGCVLTNLWGQVTDHDS